MSYREKILQIITKKGLYSIMNNTKWGELKKGISELPFCPPYIMKTVDEEETSCHQFNDDVWYLGDWGLDMEGYLGSDMHAKPYYAVEWIKVRPRYTEPRGHLIPDDLIDETEQFVEILKKYNIPYEEDNGGFIIYGYR